MLSVHVAGGHGDFRLHVPVFSGLEPVSVQVQVHWLADMLTFTWNRIYTLLRTVVGSMAVGNVESSEI